MSRQKNYRREPGAQPPKKDWWGRNWKWFVPVGCIGAVLLLAGFTALIMFSVFGMMKSSGAFEGAMTRADAHPVVQQKLGTPLEEGWFISGNINVNGPSGHADLSIPVTGPKGSGTLYARGHEICRSLDVFGSGAAC